jgi:hypothetical protein
MQQKKYGEIEDNIINMCLNLRRTRNIKNNDSNEFNQSNIFKIVYLYTT